MSITRPTRQPQFSKRWGVGLLVGLLALMSGPGAAQADKRTTGDFLQGPEKIGTMVAFSGTVIGVRNEIGRRCHVIRVDKPGWPKGMGAGGRALLCSGTMELQMGQTWKGRARQSDTGWVRMGPRWRIVPLFTIP